MQDLNRRQQPLLQSLTQSVSQSEGQTNSEPLRRQVASKIRKSGSFPSLPMKTLPSTCCW